MRCVTTTNDEKKALISANQSTYKTRDGRARERRVKRAFLVVHIYRDDRNDVFKKIGVKRGNDLLKSGETTGS